MSCSQETLEQPLYLTSDVIVVACEGIESSQLRPADAQLLLRILQEAADISSHQRDAQEIKI